MMKKKIYLIPLLLISLFFGSSIVKAESYYNINISNFPTRSSIEDYSTEISNMFSQLYNQWNTSYSTTYPYYWVEIQAFDYSDLNLIFHYADTIPVFDLSGFMLSDLASSGLSYDRSTSSYSSLQSPDTNSSTYVYYSSVGGQGYISNSYLYFFSNFDMFFSNAPMSTLGFETDNNVSWIQEATSPMRTIYSLYNFTFLSDYTNDLYEEVNLNDYAYLVLSLNSYTNLISPVDFSVLGQVCITPVYDFGMRQNPYGVTDRCFPNYSTYTDVRYYLTQEQLDNKAVYYVTPYDTSITNKIKVNTRVFSISYITSQQANNPYAIVSGKQYPVLPYSSLTSSASINEENDYIPGQVVNPFDYTSDSNVISNVFSNPLQAMKDVWQSILIMFSLIGSFISLLPTQLQVFLITAFVIALTLGLIKIII